MVAGFINFVMIYPEGRKIDIYVKVFREPSTI